MEGLPAIGNTPRVVLGCTGSVATIKVPLLARTFQSHGISVIILPTHNALHFLKSQAFADEKAAKNSSSQENLEEKTNIKSLDAKQDNVCNLESAIENNHLNQTFVNNGKKRKYECRNELQSVGHCQMETKARKVICLECEVKSLYPDLHIITDSEEWALWQGRGDPVLHIQLREWAQLMVIAPLDANTLAKLSQGLCDNLLTCVVRAWDLTQPLIFCPAMNTHMYNHPFTARQIDALKELGYTEVGAISKRLMCGDVGVGAMADLDTIVSAALNFLKKE